MTKQKLIDLAIEQIVKDVNKKDFTAIEELLQNCTEDVLENFLPESEN